MTNNIATLLTNQVNYQSKIPSTDVLQLTLTLKMTTIKVVETSVTVNNNSPSQDYVHPFDQTQPTFEMIPRFKPCHGNLLLFIFPPTNCTCKLVYPAL